MPSPRSFLDIARVTSARTRSISAENPDGRQSGGALASPGDDSWCSDAASELGRGWKVRPCLRNLEPGQSVTIADITGPGVIQHVWCTVLANVGRWITLRVYYDEHGERGGLPSIQVPLADFFANAVDGRALIDSYPIAVNPKGGMNSYWPMPFRRRIRFEITNDGPKRINEFFYQVTYSLEDVPAEAGYLHAAWRRSMTTRERPEHVILEGVDARGHYAGTYLVWNQLSNYWWGEGEIKFFIDDDPSDAPTICGTGTEDYFGGAWGFVMDHEKELRPRTYSTLFLGYPQAVYGFQEKVGPMVPTHALYRWHVPDPVRFQRNLRVTIQALGWYMDTGKYQPLTDDIASTAFWYQDGVNERVPALPPLNARLPR
jgi:hypothetical protein